MKEIHIHRHPIRNRCTAKCRLSSQRITCNLLSSSTIQKNQKKIAK
ncbi:unnamed protein product [Amoebophrya sp. A25]|nr:unnamed protein product [Amoebophrya sp. A25]|eukprot:GSA25T00027980001.1